MRRARAQHRWWGSGGLAEQCSQRDTPITESVSYLRGWPSPKADANGDNERDQLDASGQQRPTCAASTAQIGLSLLRRVAPSPHHQLQGCRAAVPQGPEASGPVERQPGRPFPFNVDNPTRPWPRTAAGIARRARLRPNLVLRQNRRCARETGAGPRQATAGRLSSSMHAPKPPERIAGTDPGTGSHPSPSHAPLNNQSPDKMPLDVTE